MQAGVLLFWRLMDMAREVAKRTLTMLRESFMMTSWICSPERLEKEG